MINLFKKKKQEETPQIENNTVGGIIRKQGANYATDAIYIEYGSSLTIQEAGKIIGKKIKSLSSTKRSLVITLEDKTQLIIEGFTLNEDKEIDSLDTKIIESIINV